MFRLVRRLFGFSVESDDGTRVTVDLEPWTFLVQAPSGILERIGIPGDHELRQSVTMALIRGRRRKRPVPTLEESLLVPDISSELAAERERLITRVPTEVAEVHAAVRAATGRAAGIHSSRRFYERRFLVKDVLNVRAAAIAVGYHEELCRHSVGGGLDALLDQLTRWPGLFSQSGEAYRSLRRTLGCLPENVPADLVRELRRVTLTRPISNPIELSAICLATRIGDRPGADQLRRILLEAREDEITRAVARVGVALRQPLEPERTADLERAFRYLADLPDPHEGRLGGLVSKAVAWHRSWERHSIEEALAKAGLESLAQRLGAPTRPPPFELTNVPGVRFLATIEDVARESLEMKHCVLTRARAALAGHCYLFHVERAGQKGTIEISPAGEIVEAAGPSNSRNDAVIWGKNVLREWWNQEKSRRATARAEGAAESEPSLRHATGEQLLHEEWERTLRRVRAAAAGDTAWLSQLDRFRTKVMEDQQHAGG